MSRQDRMSLCHSVPLFDTPPPFDIGDIRAAGEGDAALEVYCEPCGSATSGGDASFCGQILGKYL